MEENKSMGFIIYLLWWICNCKISDKNYIGIHLASLGRMIRITNGIYMESEVHKVDIEKTRGDKYEQGYPSGCSLVVGGVGWAIGSNILGLIPLVVPLNYLICGSSGWGRVFMVYSPGVSPKGPTLARFHAIKNKNKKLRTWLSWWQVQNQFWVFHCWWGKVPWQSLACSALVFVLVGVEGV